MDAAPDEHMRYDIPKYIFEHEELPNGDEVEIRNYGYGISYGYTPYLSSLVSVVFMKIASLFQVKNVGFFARNYIIHDGDFLGLKTSTEQSEIYAMDGWKPSNRITYKNQEKSIIEMIFGTKWLISTFLSYYAVFGNMSVSIPYIFYLIFIVFLLLGSVFFIRKWMMGEKQNRIFLVTGLLSCIITFLISVWYSYSSDYQPQGRYIISTLPYLMLIMTMGYKEAEGVFIKKRKWQKYFMNIIIIIWITIFGIIFTKFLNPLCSGII